MAILFLNPQAPIPGDSQYGGPGSLAVFRSEIIHDVNPWRMASAIS